MIWRFSIVVLITIGCLSILVTAGILRKKSLTGSLEECHQLRVSILVSSLISEKQARQLILLWENATPEPGDWIGLYDAEPTSNSEPLYVATLENGSGNATTPVHEVPLSSNDLGYSKKCLGYWAAYVRDNIILASSCLHTEPTWMSDMESELSPLMLRQIFLPGTHDSGSYGEYDPALSENIVTKYSLTQEEDILKQLIYGVRYFDIRAAYYGSTEEKWWLNHGVAKIRPMQTIFNDVISFMENTNEIMILDFHEFPVGFVNLDIHKEFVAYVTEQLGKYAASPSLTWNTKLGDIWSSGSRLIISYSNNEMLSESNILWPAVKQQWGDAQTLNELYTYIAGVMANPPTEGAWSVNAEMTPTAWQVITDEFGGLRRMADMVNQNVTTWYRGTWGQTVNIVSPDFFRGSGIVDAAIDWNHLRAQGITCNEKL